MREVVKIISWFVLLVLFLFTINIYAQPQEAKKEGEVKAQVAQEPAKIELKLDKEVYKGGDTVRITGKVPPGMKVNFIEVTSVDSKVQVSRLDRKDYKFYLSKEVPAFYRILIAEDYVAKIDKNGTIEEKPVKEIYAKYKENKKWRIGEFLKESNADVAFITPPKMVSEVMVWKTTVTRAIIGSRGEPLPSLTDKKEIKREVARLIQARMRNLGQIFTLTKIETKEDGTFEASFKLPENAPPRGYTVVAVVNKDVKSEPVKFSCDVSFPKVYFPVAGTSTNFLGPLILALAICTFGVLMGAGGGFILNPMLILIYHIPHGIVAGSVMPSVLFSQGSGIYNYSKIGFINWKLGITVGIFMAIGGFFGPLLNQFITLEEYKFVFGIVLLILAALMLWQTTPGYIEKSKKEKKILEEFKKRAAEAKAAKEQKAK
ncbi:MAG: TSUP family transporter [Caldimicrobium sp.]